MSYRLEINGKLFKIQAIITAVATPQGGSIHKRYQIEIDELSTEELRYTSKFAVPVGTTIGMSVFRGEQSTRIFVEVLENEKTIAGKYSVYCRSLYDHYQQDDEFLLNLRLKSFPISVIH